MYDTFLNDEFGNLENQPKSSLEKLVENYEIGLEILKKIFLLPKNELINYLKELNNEYKELFEIGFFDFKGMKIPLTGNYEDYGTYKEILKIIKEYKCK
jgi:hypothetical protein